MWGTMADGEQPISETWRSVLTLLESDDTVTPMLYGFLNLVEPKGIAAGTFYLEVPNEFTASMLNVRMRVPLLTAMGQLSESVAVTTFYVVVNPELEQESLRPVQEPIERQPDIAGDILVQGQPAVGFQCRYRTSWQDAGWPERQKSFLRPRYIARKMPSAVTVRVSTFWNYNPNSERRSHVYTVTAGSGSFWRAGGFDERLFLDHEEGHETSQRASNIAPPP